MILAACSYCKTMFWGPCTASFMGRNVCEQVCAPCGAASPFALECDRHIFDVVNFDRRKVRVEKMFETSYQSCQECPSFSKCMTLDLLSQREGIVVYV